MKNLKLYLLFFSCFYPFILLAQKDFFLEKPIKKRKINFGVESNTILINQSSFFDINGYKKNIGWSQFFPVAISIESNKGKFYKWGAALGFILDKHNFNYYDLTALKDKYVSFELLRLQLLLTNTTRVGKKTFFKTRIGPTYNWGINEKIFTLDSGNVSSRKSIGNNISIEGNAILYFKTSEKLFFGISINHSKDFNKQIKLLENKVNITKSGVGFSIQYIF